MTNCVENIALKDIYEEYKHKYDNHYFNVDRWFVTSNQLRNANTRKLNRELNIHKINK